MANRIIVAGLLILITIVLLPTFNDIISDTLIPMMNNSAAFTMTSFELMVWKAVPLVLLLFAFVAVLVTLIKRQIEGDRDKDE